MATYTYKNWLEQDLNRITKSLTKARKSLKVLSYAYLTGNKDVTTDHIATLALNVAKLEIEACRTRTSLSSINTCTKV
jgi:hypothetical protein